MESNANVFHSFGKLNSGQSALRKLAYSEAAGQISS